jgi:hypothetical protein
MITCLCHSFLILFTLRCQSNTHTHSLFFYSTVPKSLFPPHLLLLLLLFSPKRDFFAASTDATDKMRDESDSCIFFRTSFSFTFFFFLCGYISAGIVSVICPLSHSLTMYTVMLVDLVYK